MTKGKRTFHYVIRPEFDGVWHALPARAQIMYQPDRHGRSASQSLSVSR
jgi:uncharacterized protein YfaS (alpha-2-macroglobulin family)